MSVAAALLVFRHLLFCVVINDQPAVPQVAFETRQFYVYADPLRLTAYDPEGGRRLQTSVPVGSTIRQALPGPVQPLYLVEADAGMNGAVPLFDRPWALLASANHTLGANGPGPALYFYVPPDCSEFRFGGQSASPNEGGRIVINDPDGNEAGIIDGELDESLVQKVPVPEGLRDRIWRLSWEKPRTAPAQLDDLNLWLEGPLTPLLFVQREWAEKYGKQLWERDCAARGGQ